MAKFDSFDAVRERAAISLMKLAGWIATIASCYTACGNLYSRSR
jgi:hypothetical protein